MSSSYTGVDHHAKKWRARIRDGGARRTLGHYETEMEAVEAYRSASAAKAEKAARKSPRTPSSRAKKAARDPPRTLDDPWFDSVEADLVEFANLQAPVYYFD